MTSESVLHMWKDRIQEWQSSGLSQAAWCQQYNIPPNQLCYWKKKILTQNSASRLIPVPLPVPASSQEATISLPSGITLKVETSNIIGLVQELSRL